MTAERQMNEYEGSLYEAVRILMATVVELGADKTVLIERLKDVADADRADDRETAAVALELLIRSFTSEFSYVPRPPN